MEFELTRWEAAKLRLQAILGQDVVRHWLDDLELLKITPGAVVLGGLSHEVYRYDLRSNHEPLLASVLNEFFPELGPFHNKTFEYCLRSARPVTRVPERQSAQAEFAFPDLEEWHAPEEAPVPEVEPEAPARPAFALTLGDFVVCEENELAFRAAESIVASPGDAFNPLIIFGAGGTGKTHLLQGIADGLLARNPESRVLYLSGDEFLSDFVQGVREQQMGEFRKRYREVDALLLDELQVLKGAKQGQVELEQTLQALKRQGAQVILAGNQAPAEIDGLSESLRMKLEAGLIVDLGIPTAEARLRIATRKALQRGVELPGEVAEYLAHNISDSLGRLDGALTRLAAQSSLLRQPITLAMAQRALASWINPGTSHALRPSKHTKSEEAETILYRVCTMFQVTRADLLSTQRGGRVLRARQAVILLLKELTALSLAEIGERIGRNHSTVHNALRKAQQQVEEDQFFRKQVEGLRKDLTSGSDEEQRLPLFNRASLR